MRHSSEYQKRGGCDILITSEEGKVKDRCIWIFISKYVTLKNLSPIFAINDGCGIPANAVLVNPGLALFQPDPIK
jgi:hypothetical protein